MGDLSMAAAARPRASRVVFLDLARAAAVLFMIQGHALHQLLDPVYEGLPVFGAWLFLRGLTSCLFLLLSGFAFSLATDRHWDEVRRPSRRLLGRLSRFLFFLALGYLLHFPMGRFSHLQFADDERWRSFLQVDILQVVAGSLFMLQALVMTLRSRRQFAVMAGGIAAIIVLSTPLTWAHSWVGTVPLWTASFLSAETGSNFPFFPWGAFMFVGAALGMAFARRGAGRPLWQPAAAFGLLGAGLLALGVVAFLSPFKPFGDVDLWRSGPSVFGIRLGSTLVLLAGFTFISRWIRRLPGAVQALASESLTIYVVHVAILYGSLWTPGLGKTLGRQDLTHTLTWVAVLVVSMTLLAWVWNHMKRGHPKLTQAIRLTVAYVLLRPLL